MGSVSERASRLLALAALTAAFLAPGRAEAQGAGGTATATATPAWLTPGAPGAAPRSGPSTPTARGSDFALRIQGGLASGIPGGSGGGLALGGALRTDRYRLELLGRWRAPRTARFPTLSALGARVAMVEVGVRGCLELDFRTFQVPACVGAAGGRWNATTLPGTPYAVAAKPWAGAHVGLAVLYPLQDLVALFAGLQGDVSLLRPELALDPDLGVTPLRPTRFGVLAEIGVEVRVP
jgi:hypothetical protein